MRAEPLNAIKNRRNQHRRRLFTMSPQRLDKSVFSEFLSCVVERFSYAVGVEYERVSRGEWAFAGREIPFFKKPQHGARGVEPFQRIVVPEHKRGEMPAIYVAQALHLPVVLGK